MVLAMLIVPALDAIAKTLSPSLSPIQIGFATFGVQALLLAPIVLTRAGALREGGLSPATYAILAAVGLMMAISIALLFASLRSLPIANAIAIFFVAPFLVTLFAVVFLGEPIGWYRIGAIAAGLVGALIVVRPNYAAFGIAALLPLGAAAGYAAKQTIVRALMSRMGALALAFWTASFATLWLGVFLVAGSLGDVAILSWSDPSANEWRLLALAGAIALVVTALSTFALKLSPAGILAPFQYLEIVGATFYGAVLFGDVPDALTILGTAIIIAAGLFVAYREHRRALTGRRPVRPPP